MKKRFESRKPTQRYILVSDNDGHDYIIPEGEEDLFDIWVGSVEEGQETTFNYDSCRVNRSGWTFLDPQGWE